MSKLYKKNKKVVNQNLLDYLLTNYGTLNDSVYQFIKDNGIDNIKSFADLDFNTYLKDYGGSNLTLSSLRELREYVNTGSDNRDVVTGDFNDDFNEDFYI